MARRRLPSPNTRPVDAGVAQSDAPLVGLRRLAPLAQVAAESATEAALREVAAELTAARAEGRLVLPLPLDTIETEYLLRDRLVVNADEMQGLVQSLRAHGQRTPIDVADLGNGRYGLISGWRRLSALRQLMADDPARFGVVLALVRQPDTAAEAYVAMVEENEIRAGLSYWERARVVARAVEAGVFASDRDALRALFANASRPRRSKIGSFLRLYRLLDDALRFPAAVPERLGLALLQAAEINPEGLTALRARLIDDPAPTADVEQVRLWAFIEGKGAAPAKRTSTPSATPGRRELVPGLWLARQGRGRVVLSGSVLDDAMQDQLEAALEAWAHDAITAR